jgi:hypothetical protein
MTTIQGVDYAWGRPGVTALTRAGEHFACRYLSHDSSGKNLTKAEAKALSDAGLAIVVVWESTASRALGGHAAGAQDARDADAQGKACGMPTGRPIYFAADFPATPGQQAAINAYLDGAASVIGRGRVGLYGGYDAVSRAFSASKITWGWQTYAWSGGKWEPKAQLQQYSNDHVIGGVGLDFDRAVKADYGQWVVGGAPVKPPTKPPVKPPVVPPGKPPVAPPWPGRVLVDPTQGTDVLVWQRQMAARGWRIVADGQYGPASQAVCHAFQAEKHLPVTGHVDKATWAASWTAPVT